MVRYRTLYSLLVVALWLSITVLAIFTVLVAAASTNRADCDSPATLLTNSYSDVTIVGDTACTFLETISSTIHLHTSYFQSSHIIVIRVVGVLTLLVFKPTLTAMVWKALQTFTDGTPSLRVTAFQEAIGLSSSPGLIPTALYIMASRTVPFEVVFVALVSVISLLSPLAVSPVYKPHNGPYMVNVNVNVGGGIGVDTSPQFDPNVYVAAGLFKGRALLAAGVLLNIPVFPTTFDVRVAPFLSLGAMEKMWKANIDIVVARNAVDCSASAVDRLDTTGPIVTVDEFNYFADEGAFTTSTPTFVGLDLGDITNDPFMTVVYVNGTISVEPGAVTAETSVIFFGANATLESAQQTIISPSPSSRILSVDILVCTSKTVLETSHCAVENGNLTSCTAFVPANAPSDTTGTGGLGAYITGPSDTALLLAASPSTAYSNLPERLPMCLLKDSSVAAWQAPISNLSYELNQDKYYVPLSYVMDVLFGQTAQTLVQGMAQEWAVYTQQSLELAVTFGTSRQELPYLILAICGGFALVATWSGFRSFKNCHAPFNIVRLLAISRNAQLDDKFARYADLSVPVDEEVLQRRIGYKWVEKPGSLVLAVD